MRLGLYCWRVHVRRFADVLEDFCIDSGSSTMAPLRLCPLDRGGFCLSTWLPLFGLYGRRGYSVRGPSGLEVCRLFWHLWDRTAASLRHSVSRQCVSNGAQAYVCAGIFSRPPPGHA